MIAADDGKEKPKIPQSVSFSLKTKDGLQLQCTYYAGTKGKKTVPIIMLHGWEGRRSEFDSLAIYLQKRGHAVIVPDLRGHGDSTSYQGGKSTKDLDRFNSSDLYRMVQFDMESIKKFLLEKNNAGELNIELLCIIASDVSSIVAINWIAQDWSWPQLPTIKQGQDAKAVVFLSPKRSYKGSSFIKALKHPFLRGQYPIQLSILVAVGNKNSKATTDAKSIHKLLERYHPKLSGDATREEILRNKDLFYSSLNADLQGTKLLDPRLRLGLDSKIARFIDLRLVQKESKFAWKNRQRP